MRFLQSLGAMRVVLQFFKVFESIKMQAVCRWMYDKAIARIQTSVRLPVQPLYFFYARQRGTH